MKPSNPGANFSISNLQKFTLNDTQVWFIRISIDNLQETVAEIMQIIADVSWIEGLTSISKESFMARARPTIDAERSEERRVGKECRSRWSPYH